MLWADFQEQLAAYWLRKGRGSTWLRSFGAVKDRLEFELKTAIKARFPALADTRALARIATERQLDRYVAETDAQLAARLPQAFDLWAAGGTGWAISREVYNFLLGVGIARAVYVVTEQGRIWWWAGTPTFYDYPARFDFDGTARWNTFAVIVLGSNAGDTTAQQQSDAAVLLDKWRAGHALCTQVIEVYFHGPNAKLWGGWDFTATPGAGTILKWGDVGLTWGAVAASSAIWPVPTNQ